MILRVILLFISFVLIESAYEGDYCVKDGTAGVCKNLNRCSTAIQDIMNKRNPQICSFQKTALIVCCLDGRVQNPVATTKRPSVKYTTEFVPPLYEYESIDQSSPVSGCAPIDASLTSKKTGQKAFDKCIEYQEKYVYPCERGVSLLGDLSRSNNCHHNVDELIIGGKDAAQYEFPHMVMLGVGNNMDQVHWLCGGALVSEKFILTAGHCVTNRQFGPAKYALIGALKRSDDADKSKIYKVKNNILHPEYQPPNKYNDIGLIETETPIKLSQFIVPACLHAGDAVDDSRVLATGWGNVKFNHTIPANTLQKVILEKFSTSECSRTYKPVKKMKRGFDGSSQLCYGDKSVTKDTSLGDSGGPIQIKSKKVQCMYTVVGVTSFGSSFVGRPAIYTRVSSYIPWIESIVWPN